MSNFTLVKLIIHFVILVCCINQAPANEGVANKIFAVQIAASKTPLNKHEISIKHGITEPIEEENASDWQSGNSSENFILKIFLSDDEISALQRKTIDFGNDNLPPVFRKFYALIIGKSFECFYY